MACCQSNFSSDVYNVPNCLINCLNTAEPGATFVGANGSVWILTGVDPCNTAHWKPQGACCLRFSNSESFLDVCCNEVVNLGSEDNSVIITITEDGIDFSVEGLTPLPVALFYFTTVPMGGSLNATPSTSTQQGVTLTYLWSATGPGTMNFFTNTLPNPAFTVTAAGEYVVTLTVTDSNGNSNSYRQNICVLPKDKCLTYVEIDAEAFEDVENPTDAEALAWVETSGPWNCGTGFWFGNTEQAPDFIWEYR